MTVWFRKKLLSWAIIRGAATSTDTLSRVAEVWGKSQASSNVHAGTVDKVSFLKAMWVVQVQMRSLVIAGRQQAAHSLFLCLPRNILERREEAKMVSLRGSVCSPRSSALENE